MIQFFSQNWPFFGVGLAVTILIVLFLIPRPKRFSDPDWLIRLALPLYMLHQFEEHGYDLLGRHYHFQHEMCRTLGFDGINQCPATDSFIFAVNVGSVWIAGSLALLWGRKRPLVGAATFAIPLINGILHLGNAFRYREYNSGLLTSILLFIPISSWVLWTLIQQGLLTRRHLPIALASGILLHLVLIGSLRANMAGLIDQNVLLVIQYANGFLPFLLGSLGARLLPLPQPKKLATYRSKNLR